MDIMFSLFDDEQILDAYTRDVQKQSIAVGLQEGKRDNTRKIAFRMLRRNRTDEDILDTLDITPDALEAFKQEYAAQTQADGE